MRTGHTKTLLLQAAKKSSLDLSTCKKKKDSLRPAEKNEIKLSFFKMDKQILKQ